MGVKREINLFEVNNLGSNRVLGLRVLKVPVPDDFWVRLTGLKWG